VRRAVSHARAAWEVARWEFLRYFKPKQQLIGLVITMVFMVVGGLVGKLTSEPSTVELAVVGAERIELPSELGRFRFERHDEASLERLRAEVAERNREAVLVVGSDGAGTLFVRQLPSWRADLERELTAVAVSRRLETSGLAIEQLLAIQAPFTLEVHESAPRAGLGERAAAMAALFLTLFGLMAGMGYIFTSVTGEKQNRLSEQVISAIPPQAWTDGKILGLAGVSLAGILNLILAGAIVLTVARIGWGVEIPFATAVQRVDLLLVAILGIVLGFLFWFAFLAAVAAVVDDPQHSSRNQLLFLPMLTLVAAYLAVRDPTATWIRVLSIAPPTSGAVFPVRVLATEVPWWEVVITLGLLVGAIRFVRRVAGRIFRLGMLMYGKEPTWGEIWRWLRESA